MDATVADCLRCWSHDRRPRGHIVRPGVGARNAGFAWCDAPAIRTGMALRKVKANLDRVLDKNLQDLVRGIRNHKDNESRYIAECLEEIKQELRQENVAVKANAVCKLTYLQMLGYDISWAAFNIIEVMSSTKFTHKRAGYLAASQSFHQGTDVLMLTTNMIRKDLSSQQLYDSGVALSGLACFISPDLAQDLANDVMTLMTSTRPYIKKKAVLMMYKIYLNYPDALRPSFPRLKEKLEDPDPGVQSAAVNVICELARKNPKNYLSLAPLFFKLMTNSSNNWMLIKIIKLFGALTPLEPRLGKKLIEPLTNLIHSTSAMSLLYECINTVIAVLVSISSPDLPNHASSIQLCVQKLRVLIEDSDQNLKYLGLLAMGKILKTNPKSVQAHKDLILQCLDDRDDSIRLRALDLLYGMVSKKNLMEIVKKLMLHVDKSEGSVYRDELIVKIIEICSQNNYQFVVNFEWYVTVLVELTKLRGTQHGKLIASQMMDVAIRVQAIRPFAVSQMAILIDNAHLFFEADSHRDSICEILYAAAWICGEFSEHLKDPFATMKAMFKPKVTSLPGHVQSVFVQNIMKLYSAGLLKAEAADDAETVRLLGQTIVEKMPMFVQSGDLEVQERACSAVQLMKYIGKLQEKGVKAGEEVHLLFSGDLNPVAPKAQKKVPVPEGLDLDKWINDPPSETDDWDADRRTADQGLFVKPDPKGQQSADKPRYKELTAEEKARLRDQRAREQESNPHYLKLGTPTKKLLGADIDVSAIPVQQVDLSVQLQVGDGLVGLASSEQYYATAAPGAAGSGTAKSRKKKDKKKKRRKGQPESDEEDDDKIVPVHQVSAIVDMPEGAAGDASDKEDDRRKVQDPHSYLNVNLDEPLRADERLPVRAHRAIVPDPVSKAPDAASGSSSPKKTSKKSRTKDEKKHKKRDTGDEGKVDGERKHKKSKSSRAAADAAQAHQPQPSEPEDRTTVVADLLGSADFSVTLSNGNATGGPSAISASVTADVSSQVDVQAAAAPAVPVPSAKKEKKMKKEKRKHHHKERKSKRDKSEYEVAEGSDAEDAAPPVGANSGSALGDVASVLDHGPQPPSSTFRLLAKDERIQMEYDVRLSAHQGNSFVIPVIFTNLTQHTIKDIEFNVMDSMNMSVMRQVKGEPLRVPFVLLPSLQNEAQFIFSVDSISMPQKLKGTLTYIVKSTDGSSQEKLDFRLSLLCRDFLLPTPCSGETFTSLLGSGDLADKYSTRIPLRLDFKSALRRVCQKAHLTVVEQVETSASLYARSIQKHHVCLLAKCLPNGDAFTLDGKSSEPNFLSNVVDEIKELLSRDD